MLDVEQSNIIILYSCLNDVEAQFPPFKLDHTDLIYERLLKKLW